MKGCCDNSFQRLLLEVKQALEYRGMLAILLTVLAPRCNRASARGGPTQESLGRSGLSEPGNIKEGNHRVIQKERDET
jgi:hypothetical protein